MSHVQDPFWEPVRIKLSEVLQSTFQIPAMPDWISTPADAYPARSAAPLKCHADAGEWAAILQSRTDGCGELFGVPLISAVEAAGGHLLFRFTTAFYIAALEQAVRLYPWEKPIFVGPEPALYAYWRMRMLSRQPGRGCPHDPDVEKAVFLALGIVERLENPRLLRLRLLDAARALIAMTRKTAPGQRQALINQCGLVGDGCARLLRLGISTLAT